MNYPRKMRGGNDIKDRLAAATQSAIERASEYSERYLGDEENKADRVCESIIVPHARAPFGSFMSLIGSVVVIDGITEVAKESYLRGVDAYTAPGPLIQSMAGVYMIYRGARLGYRALKKNNN